MKTSRPTRTVAATLIAGSALFGLAPIANADETSGPKNPNTQTSQERKMPAPPANASKWVKRVVKQVNKFMDENRGPFTAPKYEPGKTTIVCRLQGKC